MTILALLLSLVAPTNTCETHTVASGTHVMTCAGRVSARWDDAGNVRVYDATGGIWTRLGGDWVRL